MKVFGIAGKIASGKTTTANILSKYVEKPYRMSLSDVLKDLLIGNTELYDTKIQINWQNKSFERSNLIKFGKQIKQKYGDGILMKLAIEKGKNLEKQYGYKTLIIDGVRSVGEVQILKQRGGILLYIEASPEIRFQRLKVRNDKKDKNIKTLEDLLKFDNIEEQLYKVSQIKKDADYIIDNNGTLEELENNVKKILSEIFNL